MKKISYLLSTLVFIMVLSGNVFGQEITASANVVSELKFDSDDKRDVNFANIPADITSSTPELNPTNNESSNISGGSPQLGYIYFEATSDAEVSVTFSSVALENGNGSSDHQVTFEPAVCVDLDDTRDETACTSGTTYSSGNSLILDDSGDFTIWVGGALTSPQDTDGEVNNLDAGSYTSTVSFTADYTF